MAIRRRPGRAPTSDVGHYGGPVDHVLAVVEDDDERLPGQVADDHLHRRRRRVGAAEGGCARPEGAGHRRRHPLGLGDAGQLDQPGTVPVLFAERGGGLYSQSGLAHPTRADQRHQPAAADRLCQFLELDLTTDEAAYLLAQVARRHRGCNGLGTCPAWRGEQRVLGQDAALELPEGGPGSIPTSSTKRSWASV